MRDREQEPEAGLQSGGAREDREQPQLAVRQQETDFTEEVEQSLWKHRQAPKFTGLSAGRWEFCFQIIYFNICHPSGVNFLSL